MDIELCKRNPRHRKKMHIAIRITYDMDRWLAENNFSPTRIFYQAIKELGYKEREDEWSEEEYKKYKHHKKRKYR